MMWSVRHQGSPKAVAGLSSAAVLEGVADGLWESQDEVRGETDVRWQPLAQHATFAEAVADLEPPPRAEPEDETRLDMNPLIDVCLVLLIFFILTTTYETIRKVLDMPGMTQSKLDAGARKSAAEKVKEFTIRITARGDAGKTTIRVEDQEVRPEDLTQKLSQFVKASNKRQVLLDAQGVEWGVVVQIMDAAKAANIEKTLLLRHVAAAQ
jgi:biopolymer transport protein ExbD